MEQQEPEIFEKLINVNRVAKVVKGGKRLRFSALVVVGNGQGRVGMGLGKAGEVAQAIQKAGVVARKNMSEVILEGNTIPCEALMKFGAAKVLLKPAVPGTGLIAGATVRAVMECAGVKDAVTKSLGSSNPINLVKATILALSGLKIPREEVAKRKASLAVGAEGR